MFKVTLDWNKVPQTRYAKNDTRTVTLTFTVPELQNLQRFHAARISTPHSLDSSCYEADLGYPVQEKLRAGLKSVGVEPLRQLDLDPAYVTHEPALAGA